MKKRERYWKKTKKEGWKLRKILGMYRGKITISRIKQLRNLEFGENYEIEVIKIQEMGDREERRNEIPGDREEGRNEIPGDREERRNEIP